MNKGLVNRNTGVVIGVMVGLLIALMFFNLMEGFLSTLATEPSTAGSVAVSSGVATLTEEPWYQGTFAELQSGNRLSRSPLAGCTAGIVNGLSVTDAAGCTVISGYAVADTRLAEILPLLLIFPILIVFGILYAIVTQLMSDNFYGQGTSMQDRIIGGFIVIIMGFITAEMVLDEVTGAEEAYDLAPAYTGMGPVMDILIILYVIGVVFMGIKVVVPDAGAKLKALRG